MKRIFFILALLVSVCPTRASAAVSPQAREHFERARAFMTIGDFRSAAMEFEEAFKWSSKPSMLYNAGYACRQLALQGDAAARARATDFFLRYLSALPNAKERGVVEDWIGALAGSPPSPPKNQTPPAGAVPGIREPEESPVPLAPTPAFSPDHNPPIAPIADLPGSAPPHRASRPAVVDATLLGIGALGVTYLLSGASLLIADSGLCVRAFSCGVTTPHRDIAIGFLAGGSALVLGAGAAIAILELRAKKPRSVVVAPMLNTVGAGLLVQGRF